MSPAFAGKRKPSSSSMAKQGSSPRAEACPLRWSTSKRSAFSRPAPKRAARHCRPSRLPLSSTTRSRSRPFAALRMPASSSSKSRVLPPSSGEDAMKSTRRGRLAAGVSCRPVPARRMGTSGRTGLAARKPPGPNSSSQGSGRSAGGRSRWSATPGASARAARRHPSGPSSHSNSRRPMASSAGAGTSYCRPTSAASASRAPASTARVPRLRPSISNAMPSADTEHVHSLTALSLAGPHPGERERGAEDPRGLPAFVSTWGGGGSSCWPASPCMLILEVV